jgi:hypothetical protein
MHIETVNRQQSQSENRRSTSLTSLIGILLRRRSNRAKIEFAKYLILRYYQF